MSPAHQKSERDVSATGGMTLQTTASSSRILRAVEFQATNDVDTIVDFTSAMFEAL